MRVCRPFLLLLAPAAALAEPVAPTYMVTTYATVSNPAGIALDTYPRVMNLYVGRHPDNPGTVLRVPPGGGAPVPLTATQIPDPDAVIVDERGFITGERGAVIVASSIDALSGRLTAITPAGAVSTLVESPLLNNADQMALSREKNTLYVSAFGNGTVAQYTQGHALSTLIAAVPGATIDSLAMGRPSFSDRLIVGRSDGTVTLYNPENGVVAGPVYATGVPSPVVVAGGGWAGIWEDDVYVFTGAGELRRYTAPGVYTTIGTGFGQIIDADFGNDGALYAASNAEGKIYRISCLDVTITGTGLNGCRAHDASFTVNATAAEAVTYHWQGTIYAGDSTPQPSDLSDGPLLVHGRVAGTLSGVGTPAVTFTAAPFVGNDVAPANWSMQLSCTVTTACGSKSVSMSMESHTADLGKQGGMYGHDGLYNNNDFIVFIDLFFAGDPMADVGVKGGIPGKDGIFSNNDFIAFIDMFFQRC